jgi:hypothetical protein
LLLLSLFSAWCGPCNLQSKVSGQDYYALHGRDRQNVCQSEFGSNNDFDLCLPYEFSHQNDRFGIVALSEGSRPCVISILPSAFKSGVLSQGQSFPSVLGPNTDISTF